ncbi:hypothetical protein NKG05_12505 [Oerskovia sp. M15]
MSVREARPGDRWMLCSDGLSGFVSLETLEHTMISITDTDECAERLLHLALRAAAPTTSQSSSPTSSTWTPSRTGRALDRAARRRLRGDRPGPPDLRAGRTCRARRRSSPPRHPPRRPGGLPAGTGEDSAEPPRATATATTPRGRFRRPARQAEQALDRPVVTVLVLAVLAAGACTAIDGPRSSTTSVSPTARSPCSAASRERGPADPLHPIELTGDKVDDLPLRRRPSHGDHLCDVAGRRPRPGDAPRRGRPGGRRHDDGGARGHGADDRHGRSRPDRRHDDACRDDGPGGAA